MPSIQNSAEPRRENAEKPYDNFGHGVQHKFAADLMYRRTLDTATVNNMHWSSVSMDRDSKLQHFFVLNVNISLSDVDLKDLTLEDRNESVLSS